MPQTGPGIVFGPYRLDVDGGRLWHGGTPVALQPRPLAVLAYLAARPGAVVPRDELLARVWAGTFVSKAVLKVAIRAIREALGDDADAPRWIETVGREGYRFIGGGAPAWTGGAATMVGRSRELARLHGALAEARGGTRGVVLVTGEAGAGKTTLLDRFVDEVERTGAANVARGQCLEQYGEGEAYLPILEALGTLARDDADGSFRQAIVRHAPSWVAHLAALDAAPPDASQAAITALTTPARMLREMADVLEVVTRDRALVLVLEDLQWSDRSSVDLLGCLARRRQPARLLVVGSTRPDDMKRQGHPLLAVQHELQPKGLCTEVPLALLSRDDVAAYLASRFDGLSAEVLGPLVTRVHERTEGNALFLVNMVNDLVATGLLAWREGAWHVDGSIDAATARIPAGLQELLDRRMRGLAPSALEVLEAASVVGDELAAAAVAAALPGDVEAVESICEQLVAEGALLVDAGVAEWPDGTISGRYRFRHALYREVLYDGVAEARRARLHAEIGRRMEAGFAARAGEHAAELAMHFARGRVHERALHFHGLAVTAALERHAAHEALAHCTAALDALAHRPADAERARRELELAVTRATLLMATQGYAAAETERAFARARALCDAQPAGAQRFAVLRGLLSFHQVRAELDASRAIGEELLRLADAHPDDGPLRVQAHYGVGTNLFHTGALVPARVHLEAALRAYEPATHRLHRDVYGGYDPGVACAFWLAWTLIFQGELAEAMARTREGLALAQEHGVAFSLAWAHHSVGISHQLMGDWVASAAALADAERLAEEHGFLYVLGMAKVNRGWALLQQGDLATGAPMVREGVALVDETGAGLVRPTYLGMLAAVHLLEGDRDAAMDGVDAALREMDRTDERLFEAGLLLEKANFLAAMRADDPAVDPLLQRALAVARAQGARLVELRVTAAIARRLDAAGRRADARALLAARWEWFADRTPVVPEIEAAGRLLTALGG